MRVVCMYAFITRQTQPTPPNPHARVGRDVYLYWKRVICVAKMRNVIIQTQSWRECRFGYHKLKKRKSCREEKRKETKLICRQIVDQSIAGHPSHWRLRPPLLLLHLISLRLQDPEGSAACEAWEATRKAHRWRARTWGVVKVW